MSGMSARVAAKAALESATKSSRSRRKLDPLELGAERDPVLRASTELLTLPSSAPQQRASAAALWQALETDVARMLVQSRLTDEGGPDLRVQLEQSRSERFSNWQVYALAALLLLTWLVTAYLWT